MRGEPQHDRVVDAGGDARAGRVAFLQGRGGDAVRWSSYGAVIQIALYYCRFQLGREKGEEETANWAHLSNSPTLGS